MKESAFASASFSTFIKNVCNATASDDEEENNSDEKEGDEDGVNGEQGFVVAVKATHDTRC